MNNYMVIICEKIFAELSMLLDKLGKIKKAVPVM